MKPQNLITTFFILLSIFSAFCQEEEKINAIRSTVDQINNFSEYDVIQLLNDYYVDTKNEVADNGQELKGYYKNGQLKKMVYSIGISCCMNTYEYYFADDSLIFVYEKQDIYKAVSDSDGEFIGWDYTKFEPEFEGRYYFENKLIIFQETFGNKMFDNNSNKQVMFFRDIKEHLQDLKKVE